jgi:hypothetical protein
MQMKIKSWTNYTLAAFLVLFISMPFPTMVVAGSDEPVTLETFVRAESDAAIKSVNDQIGFGVAHHIRVPTPLDQQPVIRMNRDTLYSTAVLDLSRPASVTLPDIGGRYMSLHVINQDHYSYAVSEPGRYELTEDAVGSRYVYLIFHTFIDANDSKDIEVANAAQDAVGSGSGDPGWKEL